jgi:hypothetical protein
MYNGLYFKYAMILMKNLFKDYYLKFEKFNFILHRLTNVFKGSSSHFGRVNV